MVRDVGVAEELAQDALVIALEQWPASSVPDIIQAWLDTAAWQAINLVHRTKLVARKHEQLGNEPTDHEPDLDAMRDDPVGDDLLRLVFISCHPILSREARVALTLRLVGGLSAEEIARAFLVPEGDDRATSCAREATLSPTRTCRSRSRAATSSASGWRRWSR